MKMDERLLTIVIAWILALRGRNKARLLKDDILLIYAFKNDIQLYWPVIISKIMLKCEK